MEDDASKQLERFARVIIKMPFYSRILYAKFFDCGVSL